MVENIEYLKSSVTTDNYEPFMVENKQAGEVHWLGQTNSNGEPTYSGLWRCEPMTFEYEFPGDEIIHVLKGKLSIEFAADGNVTLEEGNIACFNKGTKSTWTIQSPFKKFFVISNC